MDDFWIDDDDIEVIENPNDLGRYQSCDQFIQDLDFAISDRCHYGRMFINAGGNGYALSSITVGLGMLNRDNIQTFLENQNEQTTSAVFKEAVNNGKIIESQHGYFIVLDPVKDNIQTPDIEDNYIPVPNEPFLAYAKPSISVDDNHKTTMKWIIDDIKDVDLSGKGAVLMNHLKAQVPKVKAKHPAIAAE